MGSTNSILEQQIPCCSQNYPIAYNDSQFAEYELHKEKLGLTNKQLSLLISSWKSISSEMQAQGVTLFVEIFKSNNEVIHAFPLLNPNLKGNDAKEAMNEAFREHGIKVMSRVNEVLHNLDQLNLCVSLIKQTGAYHRRFQGFKPQYFKNFYEPFIGMAKTSLGKKYTPQTEAVYKAIANFLIQTLIDGYNGEPEQEKHNQTVNSQ
eukprot:TRINITY_DN22211_c0_g1_i1.p1 TRINITY_DN22211_c0_g1~~TRINITY_DN22211_c0_g1_i1.p1  ORF type:complete len:206 (-),score=40.26 TRINITY_DN22211_c0_g1_i1:45-662(-)